MATIGERIDVEVKEYNTNLDMSFGIKLGVVACSKFIAEELERAYNEAESYRQYFANTKRLLEEIRKLSK